VCVCVCLCGEHEKTHSSCFRLNLFGDIRTDTESAKKKVLLAK